MRGAKITQSRGLAGLSKAVVLLRHISTDSHRGYIRHESPQRAQRRHELLRAHHRVQGARNLEDGVGERVRLAAKSSQSSGDPDHIETVDARGNTLSHVQMTSAAATVRDTPHQHHLFKGIDRAASWQSAVTLFVESTSRGVLPSARTFQVLSKAMLRHRANAIMHSDIQKWGSYLGEHMNQPEAPTEDSPTRLDGRRSGGGEDDGSQHSQRWALSAEDRDAAARYVVRQEAFNRQCVGGDGALYVDPSRGFLAEGSDSPLVAALESSMRKHGAVPSMDVLSDLMLLNISWSTALQMLRLARQSLPPGVFPLAEMYERTMFLATAPNKTSFGSRPWELALSLYNELLATGYDVQLEAHASAMDAVWRSCDRTWLRSNGYVSTRQSSQAWQVALQILNRALEDRADTRGGGSARLPTLVGESGSQFYEATIRALCHSSHWHGAMKVFGTMELSAQDSMSQSRGLIPTSATLVDLMSACIRAGNVHFATSLSELFTSYGYRWKLVPHESLRTLLNVCRATLHGRTSNDAVVVRVLGELLSTPTVYLDRKVAVECLTIIAEPRCPRIDGHAKWFDAMRLLRAYEANVWPQHVVERTAELSALFRGLRRVSLAQGCGHQEGEGASHVQASVERWLTALFGSESPEMRLWDLSMAHAAVDPMTWSTALEVFHACGGGHHYRSCATKKNPRRHIRTSELPIPLRQLKYSLARSVSSRLWSPTETEVISGAEQEDEALVEKVAVQRGELNKAIAVIRSLFTSDDVSPAELLAPLYMRLAVLCKASGDTASAKEMRTAALRELGIAPRGQSWSVVSSSSLIRDMCEVEGMHTSLVEDLVSAGHASLRRVALRQDESHQEVSGGTLTEESWQVLGESTRFCW